MLRHREAGVSAAAQRKTFFVRLDPRTLRRATTLVPVILALTACGKSVAEKDAEARSRAYAEKYAKAQALFDERCKTAGEVIKRTVKDVEGIELTKIRPPIPWAGKEYFDPMYPGAAMAGEMLGDYYIKQFLMSEFRFSAGSQARGALHPPTMKLNPGMMTPLAGYRFVELVDQAGHSRQRCELVLKPTEHSWERTALDCRPVTESSTRYALDFTDIVDATDRDLWIAGTRLKVVDKRTGEALAELTKFVWDPGFGSASSGRWPWQHADGRSDRNCPSNVNRLTGTDSRYFVDTVLIPKQPGRLE